MAIQTVKSTYSLDIETVRALDRLAQRWKVTKSEALRRAIRTTAECGFKDAAGDALQALAHLHRRLRQLPRRTEHGDTEAAETI